MIKNCELCGTPFKTYRTSQRFCSTHCAGLSRLEPNKTPKKSSDYYQPVGPVYDNSTLRWLLGRSRENMVFFYREELSYIKRTHQKPSLKQRELYSLYKNGLIVYAFFGFGKSPKYDLTPYAFSVLTDLEAVKT